jgi:hypothetical protein
MALTATIYKKLLKRKLATAVFVTASIAAFASLGDGGKKDKATSSVSTNTYKNFSLRSNYHFKGENLFTASSGKRFIMLNTVVTYQKGNATYILPLKKKVLLDKIVINPTHSKF